MSIDKKGNNEGERAAQEYVDTTLRTSHYRQSGDTNERVRNAEQSADIRTNKLIKCAIISTTIAVVAVLFGCFGGLYVYNQGPGFLGLVPDSYGVKSYAELLAEHKKDVAIHNEDVRLHVIDVRLHNEDVIKHSFNVKDQRELADRLAVLNSQNKWLWHSHCVFKAVLSNDKSWLLRDGAWEFAKENWLQSELSFVAESFRRSESAHPLVGGHYERSIHITKQGSN